VSHPTEVLSVGETVTVQIIKINHETQRISLGMKQLQTDPWEGVAVKYPVGVQFKGKVTNVTDYGAFVELEPGVEGLVHVSEMSWVKKNMAPSKLVSAGTEVDVQILEVDSNKRRISLGLKQTQENPWNAFTASHPSGTVIEGEVKSITEFGLFIGVDAEIDGMVHLSDLSWSQPGEEAILAYQKGQMVKAKVLEIDVEKERVSLGIKQLDADPIESAGAGGSALRRGQVVTCTVTEVTSGGIEVELEGGIRTLIRRSDLSRDRGDQRPDRFGKGEKVDAMVTAIDKNSRRISLSIKAREVAEEKEAVQQYGSSDSGASLGDILGAALKRRSKDGVSDEDDGKDAE
jgi:small subunit ribosomal protein S1